MLQHDESKLLKQDQEDLIALLDIRFGDLSNSVREAVYEMDKLDTIQRLIMAAANAASWTVFMEELQAGEQSFKLVGERFSPI